MAKIYRYDELCVLPDDKPNDFVSVEAAQAYLDEVLAQTLATAKKFTRIPEAALRDGFQIH